MDLIEEFIELARDYQTLIDAIIMFGLAVSPFLVTLAMLAILHWMGATW